MWVYVWDAWCQLWPFVKLWNSMRFEFALIFIICLLNACLYLHENQKTMQRINSWKRILSVFYIICIRYLTCPDLTLYDSSDILLQWLNPTQKEIIISYVTKTWNQKEKYKVDVNIYQHETSCKLCGCCRIVKQNEIQICRMIQKIYSTIMG